MNRRAIFGASLRDEHAAAAGEANLSPEQVLAPWRERRETIASVQRGLEDLDAGRVKPAADVLERLGRDAE